jgi:flagellum-specific peptidoglycan hydrolase FlgJ
MIPLSTIEKQNLRVAATAAVHSENQTNCPAELTLAQWALESMWGAHQPGNNCFGIKAYHGCYGVQTLQTREVIGGEFTLIPQVFATFPDLPSCFAKHAALITEGVPYQAAWKDWKDRAQEADFPKFVHGIAVHYSTAPNYADQILKIASDPQVAQALKAARAR